MARYLRLLTRPRIGRALAGALVGATLLASCANSDVSPETTGSSGTVRNGIVGAQDAGGNAVSGGTLTFAGYTFVTGFDPAKTQASGATGGTEMAAIYDLLMRALDSEPIPMAPGEFAQVHRGQD